MWAKIPALRAACAVEVAIDAELKGLTLRAQALARREEHAAALSTRLLSASTQLPSWLDLRSLGLANSLSVNGDESESGGDHMNMVSCASLASIQESIEGAAGGEVDEASELQKGEDEGPRQSLEGGIDAFRDITVLAMGIEGLDLIDP